MIDFLARTDRVGRYFVKYAEEFVFDEFNRSYLEREGLLDIMEGVPVPLRGQDVAAFHDKGLPMLHLAENMARIIGINPQFQYVSSYIRYIRKYFNEKIVFALVNEGRDEAEREEYPAAAIHFRAALALSPGDQHAMYSYARVCRELYLAEEGGDPHYIGAFKAESTEYFELCTQGYPTYAEPYYFLGYAYLNMGLYAKASLTWKQFLKYSGNSKDKKEIKERLEQLADPVKIEEGCNHVLAGRFGEGLDQLLPYRETPFENWWPLHYYIGVAFARIGEEEEAIESFRRVLSLSPSHTETMEELVSLFEKRGEDTLADKYLKKLELVRSNREEDLRQQTDSGGE